MKRAFILVRFGYGAGRLGYKRLLKRNIWVAGQWNEVVMLILMVCLEFLWIQIRNLISWDGNFLDRILWICIDSDCSDK